MGNMQTIEATNRTLLTRRVLMVLAIPAWIALSFALFWNFPGNDDHGEGPGHVIAHLTWALVMFLVAAWFWRQRDGFVLRRSSPVALIGLFVAVGAQLLESLGAAVVWATGNTDSGNFVLHNVAKRAAGGPAIAITLAGLIGLAVGAIARRVRRAADLPAVEHA